jgi:hypothetical protein
MAISVFAIARTETHSASIISRLRAAGFDSGDISVLFPDRSGARDFAHEQHTKAPEGATAGAASGGVIGGIAGFLAGVGALAIPGLGPFIAAGPILAALSGAAVGAAVGGLTGALIGMGIPEFEAKRYEGKLKEGNILISVHAVDAEWARKARDIFEQEGADDISAAAEAPVPRAPVTVPPAPPDQPDEAAFYRPMM